MRTPRLFAALLPSLFLLACEVESGPPPAVPTASAPECPSTSKGPAVDPLGVGSPVAARWTDGSWWVGTILTVNGESYEVLYGEGFKKTLTASDVMAVPPSLEVGEKVLAAWKGPRMYPGVVMAKSAVTYTIKWDDGDKPIEVVSSQVVKLPAGYTPPTQAPLPPKVKAPRLDPNPKFLKTNYLAGEAVAARWNGNTWWIASITGAKGNGYDVLYGDGEKGVVTTNDLVPVPAGPTLAIGDHVVACWKGPQMLPGVIVAKSSTAYTIKWDDGDTPSDSPVGKVAPF